MATLDDLRRIAAALPGSEERAMTGGAAWFVRRKLYAWECHPWPSIPDDVREIVARELVVGVKVAVFVAVTVPVVVTVVVTVPVVVTVAVVVVVTVPVVVAVVVDVVVVVTVPVVVEVAVVVLVPVVVEVAVVVVVAVVVLVAVGVGPAAQPAFETVALSSLTAPEREISRPSSLARLDMRASLTAITGTESAPSASSARRRIRPVVVSSVPPSIPSRNSGRAA